MDIEEGTDLDLFRKWNLETNFGEVLKRRENPIDLV